MTYRDSDASPPICWVWSTICFQANEYPAKYPLIRQLRTYDIGPFGRVFYCAFPEMVDGPPSLSPGGYIVQVLNRHMVLKLRMIMSA